MDFTIVCVKALVPQTFVLPEANASSPTEFSGSFPACRVAVCSFRAPWSHNGVQTGNSISNAYQEFPRTSLSVREAFPMCLLLWDHSVFQPPPPGWQKNPTLLDLRHWQDRVRGATCLVDTGRDDQRGSLLVFVLPGKWRDVLESFLPETRNDILYMKFKFWGRLLVVDALLNDAGTFEYPLAEFWLELFTVQHGLYHSAGGFLGFFFFFSVFF